MSLDHRPHVGHEVRCDARGCTATTATDAPLSHRRSESLALHAARSLAWVEVTIGDETHWVCPLHQIFDQRLGRWVARPLVTR